MDNEVTPWRTVKTSYRLPNSPSSDDKLEWVEVPGGRLYRTWIAHKTGCSVALSFVPDSPQKKENESFRKFLAELRGAKTDAWKMRELIERGPESDV